MKKKPFCAALAFLLIVSNVTSSSAINLTDAHHENIIDFDEAMLLEFEETEYSGIVKTANGALLS